MSFSVYPIDKTLPLRNEKYFEFLDGKFGEARKRIWASIFIINPIVNHDDWLSIRSFLKRLAYAKWRNVDVRILIGTSQSSGIGVANNTAYSYIKGLGIPIRRFIGKYRKSLHSKYVILDDDIIIVGSHNWTPGAAESHNEDSIAIYSNELNILLSDEFIENWNTSRINADD